MAWPSCRYGPGGASAVFDCEEDVPAGWEDHPSKCAAVADKPTLADAAEAIADAQAQIAAMDGDGDGRIGGSLPKAKRKVKRNGPAQ
jgi:hypothetical protein